MALWEMDDGLLTGGTGAAGGKVNGIMLKYNGICNMGSGDVDDAAGGNGRWKEDGNIGRWDVEEVVG